MVRIQSRVAMTRQATFTRRWCVSRVSPWCSRWIRLSSSRRGRRHGITQRAKWWRRMLRLPKLHNIDCQKIKCDRILFRSDSRPWCCIDYLGEDCMVCPALVLERVPVLSGERGNCLAGAHASELNTCTSLSLHDCLLG